MAEIPVTNLIDAEKASKKYHTPAIAWRDTDTNKKPTYKGL